MKKLFMKKIFQSILFLFSAFYLMSCAAHSNLVPLGKGSLETNIGLGGPFITVSNSKIPTPYITLGADYGLSDRMNASATVHLTSFFYKIAGFDFGAAWFPILNNELIPTWGIQPRIMLLASMKSNVQSRVRAYPLVSNSAAWKLGTGLIYTGFDFTAPLTRPDYDTETPRVILSPFIGYRWKLGEKMNLLSEVKWHAANVEGNQTAAEYISLGGNGALSVMFTITRSF